MKVEVEAKGCLIKSQKKWEPRKDEECDYSQENQVGLRYAEHPNRKVLSEVVAS